MADNFKVTGQTEGLRLDAQGVPVRTMEISFEAIPSGVASKVDVPMTEYTPEHVAQLIDAAASDINAVHAL